MAKKTVAKVEKVEDRKVDKLAKGGIAKKLKDQRDAKQKALDEI